MNRLLPAFAGLLTCACSLEGFDSGTSSGDAGTPIPGLFAYWPLDENGGTVAHDVSGKGHDGALLDGPQWSDGVHGSALTFASATDALDVASLSAGGFPSPGTLSFWFRPEEECGQDSWPAIFDDWDDSRDHLFVREMVCTEISFQVAFQKSTEVQFSYLATFAPPSVGVWHHIAVAWDVDRSYAATYLDKVGSEGSIKNAWTPNDVRFRFGLSYLGSIDEIRLFDRALDSGEMAELATPP